MQTEPHVFFVKSTKDANGPPNNDLQCDQLDNFGPGHGQAVQQLLQAPLQLVAGVVQQQGGSAEQQGSLRVGQVQQGTQPPEGCVQLCEFVCVWGGGVGHEALLRILSHQPNVCVGE